MIDDKRFEIINQLRSLVVKVKSKDKSLKQIESILRVLPFTETFQCHPPSIHHGFVKRMKLKVSMKARQKEEKKHANYKSLNEQFQKTQQSFNIAFGRYFGDL